MKNSIGLGDLAEKIINIITLGYGKRIATWVAKLFGYNDCGCDKRKKDWNKIQIKR
mgnify:FL=1|tara:strand:- start:1257 stop:1424 length:168 start_codon:yes stop_codon:yes gene_type:complete